MVELHEDTVVAEVLSDPLVGHRDGGQGMRPLRGVLLGFQRLDVGDEVVGPVEVRAEVRAVCAVALAGDQGDSDLEVGHALTKLVVPSRAQRLLELDVVDRGVVAPADFFGELHESRGQLELALVPAQTLSLQFNTDALRRVEVAEPLVLVLLPLEQPNEAEVSVLLRLVDQHDLDERVVNRRGTAVVATAVRHNGDSDDDGDNQGRNGQDAFLAHDPSRELHGGVGANPHEALYSLLVNTKPHVGFNSVSIVKLLDTKPNRHTSTTPKCD